VDASVWILGLWVGAVRTRASCGPQLAPWPPGPHQSQDVIQNNRADRWAGLGEKECCGAPGTWDAEPRGPTHSDLTMPERRRRVVRYGYLRQL